MTIGEIETYHSIVYGHFAIALGISIMYTPYAEQSIAVLLYTLLTLPLLVANARRMEKTTRFFWICTFPRYLVMACILMFLFTCGLL